jgi:hypothetical protein
MLTVNDPTIAVSFVDDSPSSGIGPQSLLVMLDGVDISGRFALAGSGATYTIPPAARLADGTHRIKLAIEDAATNRSSASSSFGVITTPPTLTVTSPADGSYTREESVRVEGTVSASGPTGTCTSASRSR